MRTVSFQGTQLTSGQRRRLQEQQQARPFVNPVLQQQVNETLAALDARQSQGIKPERQWFLEFEAKGTPCVAELFGF
ncbi:MAG: hypothetical protein BFD77_08035 [Pseudomonas sp. CO183]|nr:MAG: hypothetical protein BFD77_08035 [Pseudomonas sp. CO183]